MKSVMLSSESESALPIYRKLIGDIANLPPPESSVESNLEFIREISEPIHFMHLLRELMSVPAIVKEIGSRSYRHVNHFDKIVLVDCLNDNGYRLTLHIWAPPFTAEEIEDELIHDHRFSFWSGILVGTLSSQEFVADPGLDTYQSYRYTPENLNAENFYEFQGRFGLTKARKLKVEAGGTYYLSYDTTHRVELPETEMTCTLVLRGPRQRTFSNVYNTAYPATNAGTANRMFDYDEMFGHFTRLYSELLTTRRQRQVEQRTIYSVD
ncbi:hypothetical protein [Erythrobacter donghaensis]|uniref:hypothetical protein n=1 Tax=Erythrobacter donghaensis TaxID=267135 RepID=UPI000A4FC1D0|nr:hypothetical protein [Erythrobacter donghaensis]